MAVHVGNGRNHPRLRTRWLGAGLAVALAALQLYSPVAAIAQDVEVPPEPAAAQTATDSVVSPDAVQDAVPAADSVDPAAATAATWYVDGSSGTDGAACNSAGSPCRTIQDAINRAGSGDTILVAGNASGIVYTFAAASPCTNGLGANIVACVNDKKLTIRGGYTPGSYASYAPSQNLSIIDGQGKNRGVAVLGFSNVPGTTLDIGGFTVRNGYGTGIGKRSGVGSYFGFGGGMLVENAGAVTLRDMVFDSNRAVGGDRGSGEGGAGAGGGASFHTATVNLENVRFTNNQAQGGAGAERGGYAQGGAIFTYNTTLTGSGVWLENNIAQAGNTGGSGRASDGQRADALGGAASFSQGSKITLNNVTVRGNQGYGGNAATYAGGAFGGGFFGEEAEININGADIVGNLAKGGAADNGWIGSGGGISAIHSTLNVNRARILANTAQAGNGRSGEWGPPNGGGITISWVAGDRPSLFTLSNSFVAGNKASRGEGAKITYGGGGGLWIQATDATLDHATIANNQLGSGPGLYGQGVLLINTGDRGANVTIRNSLVTGHTGDAGSAVEVFSKNTVTFAGGLFAANTWNTSRGNPNQGQNIGTINGQDTMGTADPLYMSVGAPDYNYHIQSNSPARNKASGSQQKVDIDNEPRSDGSPDYGADEAAGAPQGLPSGRVKAFLPRISH